MGQETQNGTLQKERAVQCTAKCHRALHHKKKEGWDAMQKQKELHCKNKRVS